MNQAQQVWTIRPHQREDKDRDQPHDKTKEDFLWWCRHAGRFSPTPGAILDAAEFTTGPTGTILGANLVILGPTEDDLISTSYCSSGCKGEDEGTLGAGFGINFDSAGQWSPAPSATPLPVALPLFGTGLGAFGLFGWRRKRKAQVVAA
jgi:hypothetical protein